MKESIATITLIATRCSDYPGEGGWKLIHAADIGKHFAGIVPLIRE
jgi:hypothetical protein